ncbi:MAG: hypothetical protein B6244_11745 [Candidatus Cloacimonetes bacterium 4572_55]|nr:MAG: hypothetical protein B6244_11745 [Candidatus Cloacimonetes bacterium 4572_55]
MNWYTEAFTGDYLTVYSHRNRDEAQRQIRFVLEHVGHFPGQIVLDLACGNGRHALELTEQGYRVVGLDLSTHLLSEVRVVAADRRALSLICGDMRYLPFKEDSFDLILSMFTSFGYFDVDDENISVLSEVARLLKPGGSFFMDYLNPERVKSSLIPESIRRDHGMLIKEKRRINEEKQRVEKEIILEKKGQQTRYRESVRLFSHVELIEILSSVGLTVIRKFGDYESSPFSDQSSRMILISKNFSDNRRGM